MRDEEDRVVLGARDVEEEPLHPPAGHRVERPERLVHQDDARLVDERPRDGDALLHAAREVLREALGEVEEADLLQHLARPLAALLRRDPLELQAVLDVLLDREPAERRVGLEDHAAVAARLADRLPVEEDLPLRRREEAGDGLQDRRLAAPRGAEEDDDLAHPGLVDDVEGDVADGLGLLAVAPDVRDREVLDGEARAAPARRALTRRLPPAEEDPRERS